MRRRAARGGAIRCFMDVKLAAAARARNVRGSTPESGIFAWVLPPSTLYNRYDGHPRKYGAGRARQTAQHQRLWRLFDQGSEDRKRDVEGKMLAVCVGFGGRSKHEKKNKRY